MKKESRQDVVQRLTREHRLLERAVSGLSESELTQVPVLDHWTIKDILAHILAWNEEYTPEIDRVLQGNGLWQKRFASRGGEDEFNRKVVERHKNNSVQEVIVRWQESFKALIKKVESLTDEEWNFQSSGDKWEDGTPVTVYSLFLYEYEGSEHEGGHAKQILRWKKGRR